MRKVREHGYYRYETQCSRCNCMFEYEIPDIKDDGTVNCPDCGAKCLHFKHNFLSTSRIQDCTYAYVESVSKETGVDFYDF